MAKQQLQAFCLCCTSAEGLLQLKDEYDCRRLRLQSHLQQKVSQIQRRDAHLDDSDVECDGKFVVSLVTSNDEHASSDGALYFAQIILHLLPMLPRRRFVSDQVVRTLLFTTLLTLLL